MCHREGSESIAGTVKLNCHNSAHECDDKDQKIMMVNNN